VKALVLFGALLAAAITVPVVAIGVAFGGQLGQLVSQEPATTYAENELPAVTIRAFEESAEQCVGIPWQVLAAVNLTVDPNVMADLDTVTGEISPPFYGLNSSGPDDSAGAVRTLGPMGFSRSTWTQYAQLYPGAPSDAVPDPQNEFDAIFTLGRVLCALEATAGDIDDALLTFDASPGWVSSVLTLATEYGMNVDGTTTDIGGGADANGATGPGPPAGLGGYSVSIPPGESFNGSGAAFVAAAETELGVPYVWGGVAAHVGLDCSGLVVVAMAAIGFNLLWTFRTSQEQSTLGTIVVPDAARRGDLLFFEGEDTTGPSLLGHVAIYVGNNQMIEAPETGEVVRFSAVPWGSVEIARRILTGT
jgi:cell wall-associated NlpC family hydrolase